MTSIPLGLVTWFGLVWKSHFGVWSLNKRWTSNHANAWDQWIPQRKSEWSQLILKLFDVHLLSCLRDLQCFIPPYLRNYFICVLIYVLRASLCSVLFVLPCVLLWSLTFGLFAALSGASKIWYLLWFVTFLAFVFPCVWQLYLTTLRLNQFPTSYLAPKCRWLFFWRNFPCWFHLPPSRLLSVILLVYPTI